MASGSQNAPDGVRQVKSNSSLTVSARPAIRGGRWETSTDGYTSESKRLPTASGPSVGVGDAGRVATGVDTAVTRLWGSLSGAAVGAGGWVTDGGRVNDGAAVGANVA